MFAIFLTEGMDPFYQNIGSFPTVIFTFLLGITVLYWVVAVLGLVEIDALDFNFSSADADFDASGTESSDVLAGLMLKSGLVGVPVTVIISIISLVGWLICYYLVHFTFFWVPDGLLHYVVGLPIFILSFYIAVMITAQLIKPLRPLFKKATQETVKQVLGQTAVVRSSRVDSKYGEAILEDGGAGLILKVRATGDSVFAKGDRVVLLEHLKDNNTYRVISEGEFSGDAE